MKIEVQPYSSKGENRGAAISPAKVSIEVQLWSQLKVGEPHRRKIGAATDSVVVVLRHEYELRLIQIVHAGIVTKTCCSMREQCCSHGVFHMCLYSCKCGFSVQNAVTIFQPI